jgi:hypothetical protein
LGGEEECYRGEEGGEEEKGLNALHKAVRESALKFYFWTMPSDWVCSEIRSY